MDEEYVCTDHDPASTQLLYCIERILSHGLRGGLYPPASLLLFIIFVTIFIIFIIIIIIINNNNNNRCHENDRHDNGEYMNDMII